MKRHFKYDIAISVAEEDKEVAELIAAELKKKKIRCYFYEEEAVASWGEYIINLTKDSFGGNARYVLMITSSSFVQKYWSNVERQWALANKARILQLRLDDTKVDGISMHVVHRTWENNPEKIADILEKKIARQKRLESRNLIRTYVVMIAAMGIIFLVYCVYRICTGPEPRREMKKVLVAPPALSTGTDPFYISETEVTVAQYRRFCISQKKSLPLQPPVSNDNYPVVNITWFEAEAFCEWVNGRLPTQVEWELAANAGQAFKYSGSNNASNVAIYNKSYPGIAARKASNALGLFDMTGNAAEWCDDWIDTSATWKAVRGGSYKSKIKPVNELAIAYPDKECPDARQPYIGFRVAWNK
ncbi:SUMF1/EgtB/PvdO family nonheme iron enzyme [Chitinophaga tropicalis]|uniref:SUMF1/EgtB/PvdO family nonheme iron enzyme n=1 Tax=Chitinophaga tropicalis TaxID=2683588 RepID=A0A7K1U9J8_9BACT|nr:SUMF1/EgtB/PvdO family nonheme iron enzyme [Chitinophaga tropicalis]MVT11042.1 SUMF1/EgtB/PvdO family nonheme iron enzyme [Chitinophaga tropicalis]